MNHTFAMAVMIYAKSYAFNDVSIVSIEGRDLRIYFWYMSKSDSINIVKSSDLKLFYLKLVLILT